MSILTVGSVAYDHVITPTDRRERALGGSATFFSLAAAHFTPVSIVAVVGEDFNLADGELLKAKGIDLSGLDRVAGKCFYWKGEYHANWNDRVTHDTQLNVFQHFKPKIPQAKRDLPFVFLGNIHPSLQLDVVNQMLEPKLVCLDTMNMWIKQTRTDLLAVLRKVNVLIVNDSEAAMLSGHLDLVSAAATISKMGPRTICIKRGEHGAFLYRDGDLFLVPSYPLCRVVDPTGAGDAFAGGFVGYLAQNPDFSFEDLKRAVVYGSVMGSFTVESFSVDRLAAIGAGDIADRYRDFVRFTHFDG